MGGGAAIGVGGRQELHGAVGDRVGVAAVRGQHEVAEIGAGAADGELEMILAGVDVGDGDRAGCGQVAGDDAGVLGHISNGRGADHRGIVGAVDGETDVLGGAVRGRFCFNDTAATEIYTLALRGALPIGAVGDRVGVAAVRGQHEV